MATSTLRDALARFNKDDSGQALPLKHWVPIAVLLALVGLVGLTR